jgi:hypothetical protein
MDFNNVSLIVGGICSISTMSNSKDGSFNIAVAFTRSRFHRPEEGAQANGIIPIPIETPTPE